MTDVNRLSEQLKAALEVQAKADAKAAAKAAADAKAMDDVLTYLKAAIQDHLSSGKPFGKLTRAYLEHPSVTDATREYLSLTFDLLVNPVFGVRQTSNGISFNFKNYKSIEALYQATLSHLGLPEQTATSRWFGRMLQYLATAEEPNRGMASYEASQYLEPLELPEDSTIAAHSYMSHFGLTEW